MPDKWEIEYKIEQSFVLRFKLSLTSFKHVGIFPEQAVNWDYIYKSMLTLPSPEKGGGKRKFLNLFAYTGAASLAAKAAGANVTHLDSVKQVITWARENMELSGLKDIRWVVEDALKFARREVKRGNKYQGIILDPPAYGIGASGEKWKLEDNIQEMLKNVLKLLDEENHFLILNVYSLGFSSLIIENLLKDFAKDKLETGEIYLCSATNLKLPMGVFGRFKNF
jgi:23S rRNA (cytosine1962-C5)-methyltransferase